jgi:N-acetylmuramoyl-L-alanine amidase
MSRRWGVPMKVWMACSTCMLVLLAVGCRSAQQVPARVAAEDPERGNVEPPRSTRIDPSRLVQPPVVAASRRPGNHYASPARPPLVEGNLDVSLGRQWKHIVIHHSGTDMGSEETFDRYHREHNKWLGVGYDFVIGNGNGARDGLVEVTFRWEQQIDGAHANHPEYNKYGIGICVVGDFNVNYPSPAQIDALVGLLNYLQERCRIPTDHVLGHRHVRTGSTDCPGKRFPWYEVISRLRH